MKTAVVVLIALAATDLPAQQTAQRDTRPIHAYASLPAVGTQSPPFSFPTTTGATVSNESLRGAPTVLAFWSTWCSASRALLGGIEALRADYAARGVRIVIVAQDSLADLRHYRDSVGVTVEMAAAPKADSIFNHSASAPERETVRVAWALPLFLVLDREGRVIERDGGPAFPRIRAALDTQLVKR